MTPLKIAELVVRMASEDPRWGYTRIGGALANLGHDVARDTVKRILQDHGIEPAPERSRRTPWKTFLQAHWAGLAAADLVHRGGADPGRAQAIPSPMGSGWDKSSGI